MKISDKKTIIVGSRDSQLAVVQTQMVMKLIAQKCPEITLEMVTMKTTGDLNLNVPLPKFGQEDLFTKELERCLRTGEIDICVHSYKDLPLTGDNTASDLPIVALSQREDPRDALVLPQSVAEMDFTKPIGSSSLRRTLQLKQVYPQAQVSSIRGNIVARIAQLDQGDYGGIILAMAGLNRLGLEHRASRSFTVDEMMPSASQGVLAVQGRAGENFDFLELFNHPDSFPIAAAERGFTRVFDGGFSSPVAAYAIMNDGVLHLSGMFVDEDQRIIQGTIQGKPEEAATLGVQLAQKLKANGTAMIGQE